MAYDWLKMGHFTFWGTPNVPESFMQKHIFDPIVIHRSFRKARISKAFWDF